MRGRGALVLALALVMIVALAVSGCAKGTSTTGGTNEEQKEKSQGLKVKIVEDWAKSAHARPVVFAAEESGCQNCHDGLTFTQTGGGFQPRFATSSAEAPRDWVVATDCRACHTGVGPTIAEKGSIEGVPSLPTAKGGLGALCMACHNGWHPSGPGRGGNPSAPHLSVQTDMLFGINTVDVGSSSASATAAGETSESPHAKKVKDTCVGCHLAGSAGPNHLFKITDFKSCQRKDCHKQDMTDGGTSPEDLDGDGTKEKVNAEVQGMMDKLKAAINKKAGSSEFKSEHGQVAFVGSQVTTASPAYKAAYNYFYVMQDKSMGIHNFGFTSRLLQQSLDAVSQ
jgi:hypothetical protein